MFRACLALLALVATPGVAAAIKAAPPRYYFEVSSITATDKAPAEVSVKARTVLGELLGTRAEFVTKLEGAPDPAAAPADFQRWLDRRRLRAFKVNLNIDTFERSLAKNEKPGESGQILTIKLGVALVGSALPGNAMALAGNGTSTVVAEVGMRLRPGEEESVLDSALRDALTHAIDDAVARLKLPATQKKKRR